MNANRRKQEEKILTWFSLMHWRGFTPEEIHSQVFSQTIPLTSVRRGISELTAAGKLEKTDETRKGYYGCKSHVWRLAGKPAQTQMEIANV